MKECIECNYQWPEGVVQAARINDKYQDICPLC